MADTAVRGRTSAGIEVRSEPPPIDFLLACLEEWPAAHALVAYDRRSGRGIFFATDLPAPPPGAVYQLWAIADGVRPAAVLGPDARGGTILRDGWPRGGESLVFAVTLEPANGSGDPTGPFLFRGSPR